MYLPCHFAVVGGLLSLLVLACLHINQQLLQHHQLVLGCSSLLLDGGKLSLQLALYAHTVRAVCTVRSRRANESVSELKMREAGGCTVHSMQQALQVVD
jgi:hypothetical protein